MPYNNSAACVLGECEPVSFPTTAAACDCDLAAGGISEIYFIPCTEVMSQANVTDIEWWSTLIDDNKLGLSGAGLGKIAKKATKSERVSSCRTEEITSITWALNFVSKCFDKTSDRSTCAKMNEIIRRGKKYLVIARMCDGDENVLPIGITTLSDVDWQVPDNAEDKQFVMFELSWIEFGMPCTVDVAGLSAILPKAA